MRAPLSFLLVALLAGAARAAPPAPDPYPPACDAPPESRPPDPRCGEALDGRRPPEPPSALIVPRAVLWVPRLTSRVVFWPVVRTSDLVESNRVLGWARSILTTDDGLVGVRPELRYSTSFISTAGLRLFWKRLPGAGTEATARFLTAGPSVFDGRVELHGPDRYGLTLGAGWSRRDDRLFAGIGPASDAELAAAGRGRARYGSDALAADLRWLRRLPGRFSTELHGDLARRDYQAGDVRGGPSVAALYGLPPDACAAAAVPPASCVDPALVPGFGRGLRVAHAGGTLALDLRDPARDGSGASAAVGATFAEGLGGDPSRHVLVSGESVLALGGSDRVLLLRAWGAMVEPLGDAPVPFEELVSPSGSAGMRGFPEGRFRDRSGLVGTAEYRWFNAFNLDASLFADVGTVAGRAFSDLRWDRWYPSFGAGLRLSSPVGPYWMATPGTGLQVAYAPGNGFRALFSLAAF